MKALAKNCLVVILPVLLLLCLFTGCHEKGCTDPHALNYNIVADVDDGSCIICQTTQTQIGLRSAFLVDFNFSSPHRDDTVAIIYIYQIKDVFNHSECGGANSCTIYYQIQSLVPDSMDLPYHFQCNGNNIFFSFSDFRLNIPPFGATPEEVIPFMSNIAFPCSPISNANVFFNTNGTINYH